MQLLYILSVIILSNGLSIPKSPIKQTKQIATIGPSCNSLEKLSELHENGVDIFRINLSHGDKDLMTKTIEDLHKIKKTSNKKLEIMMDLQGPKHRIGNMKTSILKENNKFILDKIDKIGNDKRAFLPHDEIYYHIQENDTILLDDGLIELKVDKCIDNSCIVTTIIKGGELKSKKGVNLPYVDINWIKPTNKDIIDISFINNLDIDWVAVSFVESHKDIINIWRLLKNKVKIMAKIERPKAVEDLDNIIEYSDGIMIARGDLGVEMGLEKVPFIQKLAIKKTKAKDANCEAIVATQMLESMVNNKVPTRAEVSDIANAVIDGASGVMLSAETSVGKYPLECVKIQRKVIEETERFYDGILNL